MKKYYCIIICLFSFTLTSFSQLAIGKKYKGGIIFELYPDGSGGKVCFQVVTGTFNGLTRDLDQGLYSNGIKLYMANDYDLQKLFKLDLIGPNAGDGKWNSLWWMGQRRMISYGKPIAYSAKEIVELSQNSSERVAEIVKYGSVLDRYEGKCYAAYVGIFDLK